MSWCVPRNRRPEPFSAAFILRGAAIRRLIDRRRDQRVAGIPALNSVSLWHTPGGTGGQIEDLQPTSFCGGTKRRYGAGGEEMETSSLHVTDGVPRCPSRTT